MTDVPGRKLLVVDDDDVNCRLVAAMFTPEGYAVRTAHSGPEGIEAVTTDAPDLVILDLRLPGMDGLEILDRLRVSHPTLPIILLTGVSDVKMAVRATQLGAFDYQTKPINHDELLLSVRRAMETRRLREEVEALRRRVGEDHNLHVQMGPSAAVQHLIEQVETVAASDFSVLVLGETGVGKDVVARAIHRRSARGQRPFVALDCGAIPETLLESELFGHEKGAFTGAERKKEGRFAVAEGGTLFLDEVGNLPIGLQAKLLRVLESRQVQAVGATRVQTVDIRFVAATNADLQARAAAAQFRADLYFRLAQYTIHIPPLRERPGDIPYLAQRFLEEASVELRRPVMELPTDVMNLLQRHRWPGNVRELRNVIRHTVLESKDLTVSRATVHRLLGKTGGKAGVAAVPGTARSLREIATDAAREAERAAINDALREARGNKSQAARSLKTDYKTLHLKMAQLGIRARDFLP